MSAIDLDAPEHAICSLAMAALKVENRELRAQVRRLSFKLGDACPFCGWDQPQCDCKGSAR